MSLPLRTLDATDSSAGPSLPAPTLPHTRRADLTVLRRVEQRAPADGTSSRAPANDTGSERRIVRMLRDCEVSPVPALLLAAVCSAIAAIVALGA